MYLNKFLLNNMRTLLISTRWIKNDEICINIWQYIRVHCSQLTSIKYVKVFLSFVFFLNEKLPLSICMYGSISLTSLHELSFMMCCGLCVFSICIECSSCVWLLEIEYTLFKIKFSNCTIFEIKVYFKDS